MKRKVVDVIMKFDYILEEDEEQRNVVYIDDQGVKRKRLS